MEIPRRLNQNHPPTLVRVISAAKMTRGPGERVPLRDGRVAPDLPRLNHPAAGR